MRRPVHTKIPMTFLVDNRLMDTGMPFKHHAMI